MLYDFVIHVTPFVNWAVNNFEHFLTAMLRIVHSVHYINQVHHNTAYAFELQ